MGIVGMAPPGVLEVFALIGIVAGVVPEIVVLPPERHIIQISSENKHILLSSVFFPEGRTFNILIFIKGLIRLINTCCAVTHRHIVYFLECEFSYTP